MSPILRVLALATALALAGGVGLAPPAWAQDAGIVVSQADDGSVVVAGSMTVDGVVYTAAEVEGFADLYYSAPDDLVGIPEAVFEVVTKVAHLTNPVPAE